MGKSNCSSARPDVLRRMRRVPKVKKVEMVGLKVKQMEKACEMRRKLAANADRGLALLMLLAAVVL